MGRGLRLIAGAVLMVVSASIIARADGGNVSMNFIDRGAKALQLTARQLVAKNPVQTPYSRFPMGKQDYTFAAESQNGYLTSTAVFTCTTCWALHYPQIRFQVTKGTEPGGDPLPDHPAQYLLDHPNDDMDMGRKGLYDVIYTLLGGISQNYLLRNGRDQIIGIRPYSTAEIRPVFKSATKIGRETWIDHYMQSPLIGGAPLRMEANDVIPLTWLSVNPLNPELSVSPFAAAFLDIQADVELTKFPLELMKNGAFTTFLLNLGAGTEDPKVFPSNKLRQVKGEITEQITGGNKYSPLIVRGGAKGEVLTPNLGRTGLAELGERSEIRICSSARVPPVYAGISSGVAASTYDNVKLSRIGFVKDCVLALATVHAKALSAKFQKENWRNHIFGDGNSDFTIDLDLRNVMALRDEQQAERELALQEYNAGIRTMDETRRICPDLPDAEEGVGDQFKAAPSNPVPIPLQEIA